MPAFLKKILKTANLQSTKILLGLLFILVFLASTTASFLYLSFNYHPVKPQKPGAEPKVTQNTLRLPTTSDAYNVLLLGYGGEGHDGGTLSDTIIIAHVRPKEKRVALVSMPRDLWVEIPIRSDIRQSFKINHAYAIGLDDKMYPLKEPQYKGESGGATLAKKVIGEVSGMQMKHIIAVDFDGFKNIIDILEGIEVNVPVTFDDYFYPIKGRENDTCGKSSSEIAKLHSLYSDTKLHQQFECRYEHIHFDAGQKLMDGETALKFVRSRNSPQHGGDFARSTRQQAVLIGIKNKLISGDAIRKVDELFEQFLGKIRTDLDLKTVKDLINILGSPEDYSISFVSLSEDNVLVSTKSLDGQFILIPKEGEGVWNGFQNYIFEQISAN